MGRVEQQYPARAARLRPLAKAVATAVGIGVVLPVPAATVLEEVVVTATRRETTIQDIPFNIAVFSGEDLTRQRIGSLSDFARLVPGLNQVDQGPRGADLLTVRGLNSDSLNASEFLDNSSGDTVATYIGEIPLYMDMKLVDIERVEVLLGPQGTLYGSSTLAGAIRYIPKRPDLDSRSVEFKGSAYDLAHGDGAGWNGDVIVNVPLIDDTLAFRGMIGYVSDPGFIDYNFLVRDPGVSNPQPAAPSCDGPDLRCEEDVNDEETLYARMSLLWDITDNIQANLSYYVQDQEAGGRQITHRASFADLPAYDVGNYVSAHRYVEPNDRKNQLGALEITMDFDLPVLGPVELTSATGLSKYEEVGQRDQTDLLLNFEYGYEFFPAFAAFTREEVAEYRRNQELRLVSKGDGPLNWIIGGFYNYYDTSAVSIEFTPGIPAFFGTVRPDNIEFIQATDDDLKEVAVFGEVSYRFTDPWQVTFGGRWFEYENEVSVCFDLPLFDTFFGGPATGFTFDCQPNEVKDDDVIFKVNTSYDLNDDATVYATWSEGYRIGGVNSVPPCPDPIPPGQNICALPNEVLIAPDTTTNYEVGLHSRWLDGRLQFNGAVFYIDWDDIQTFSTTVNGAIPITVNGAAARTWGIEASWAAQVAENIRLQASYSFADAELSADAPLVVDGAVDGLDGDRLPGSPKHKGALYIVYTRPFMDTMNLDLSYGFTAQSSVITKIGERNGGESLDGFAIHNVAATLYADKWEATLFADNLTDEFAVTSVRQDRTFVRDVGGVRMRRYFENVLAPRQVGLTMRYHFDL